jgi:DNA polymerase
MGRAFRVTQQHGEIFTVPWAAGFVATIHPSALLRASTRPREAFAQFVDDLRAVAAFSASVRRSR